MLKQINWLREGVRKVPFYKFAWILVITIAILSIIAALKLDNFTVFSYTIAAAFITFLGWLFARMANMKDKVLRIAVYFFAFAITITLSLATLGFGLFVFTEKPKFYKRWFPDLSDSSKAVNTNRKDSTNLILPDNTIPSKPKRSLDTSEAPKKSVNKIPNTSQQADIPKETNGDIRIAILPFAYLSKDSSYSWLTNGIPEAIVNKVARINHYAIIEGLQRNKVLDEINFQQGSYVDAKTAVTIGKMLGANQILIGSCQINNQDIRLSARVVVVETGLILKERVIDLTGVINKVYEVEQTFADKIYNALNK